MSKSEAKTASRVLEHFTDLMKSEKAPILSYRLIMQSDGKDHEHLVEAFTSKKGLEAIADRLKLEVHGVNVSHAEAPLPHNFEMESGYSSVKRVKKSNLENLYDLMLYSKY